MSQASQRIKSSQSSAEAKAKRTEAIRLALLEMNATESSPPKILEAAGSDASNSDGLSTQTNAPEEIVPSSQPEITEDTPMDPGMPACPRFKVSNDATDAS